jgi:hypothetical protein
MDSDKPKGDASPHALEYSQNEDHSDSNLNRNSSDSTSAGDDEKDVKRKRCMDDRGRNGQQNILERIKRSQSVI